MSEYVNPYRAFFDYDEAKAYAQELSESRGVEVGLIREPDYFHGHEFIFIVSFIPPLQFSHGREVTAERFKTVD